MNEVTSSTRDVQTSETTPQHKLLGIMRRVPFQYREELPVSPQEDEGSSAVAFMNER